MKVCELLRFYAELKGCRTSRPRIDSWLERLGLAAWGNKKIETLSKGMAQKVQFIATVIAGPELIILDEPFSGLDPVNMEVLRDAILDLRRQGTTILFSTHDMAVSEKMCDFVLMIYKGRKVLDGTLASIQATFGQDTLRVRFAGPKPDLDNLPGVLRVADLGRFQELRLQDPAASAPLVRTLLERGALEHFEIAHPSLHDIFVRVVNGQGSENRVQNIVA